MAVHIVGRAPVADAGEYYRIPFERWRRVLAAMRAQHAGLVEESVLEGMVYNHGEGVLEDEVCVQLAERLRGLLASPRWPALADELLREDRALESLALVSVVDGPSDSSAAAQRTQLDDDVARWISFLESCGGFAVW